MAGSCPVTGFAQTVRARGPPQSLLWTVFGAEPSSVAAIFTIAAGAKRGLECDQDCAELNDRTFIRPLSRSDIDAKLAASTHRRSGRLSAIERRSNRFLNTAAQILQEVEQNVPKIPRS
jgi:hypothetical protein